MQSIPICHLLRFESEPNINQGGSFDFVLTLDRISNMIPQYLN